MNTDEIVRALRCVQEKHKNDRLLTFQTDVSAMARDAADMIESMQAQLADYHHMSELVDGKTGENQRLRRINENLQEQLAASQRRERAAVEDIHTVYSDGLCEVCGRLDTCLMTLDRGEDGTVCHGIRFEWRGPQEAEKGENNA